MISRDLSRKLYLINFFLILLVVVLHAANVSNRIKGFTPGKWNYFIQSFFSSGVCFVAVPLFFVISGFLFFDKGMEWPDFKKKIWKRVRSILIPYLLVSFTGIIVFYILQSIPLSRPYFNNQLQLDLPSLLKTWLVNPLAYQLWFLRNLFILVLLSPLIYWFVKKVNYFGIILFTCGWFFIDNLFLHNIILCLLFFSFGAYLKIFHFDSINNYKATGHRGALWIASWGISIILAMAIKLPVFIYILTNISICIGIFAIWILFDKEKVIGFFERKQMKALLPFTFIIFLFHEPLLTIIIKLMFSFFKVSDTASIAIYITSPVMTVAGCALAGWALKNYIKPVYSIIAGNR